MSVDKKKRCGVILINTGTDSVFKASIREKYNYPPYGLLSMASVLKAHGYKVYLIDLLTEALSSVAFIERLHAPEEEIIAVGIPTYTESFHLTIEVSKIVKEELPKAKVILGGVHVTFRPEDGLQEPTVDFVVRGEGESTIVMLLEHIKYPKSLPLECIYGITYRNIHGTLCSTIQRRSITLVDILPLPQYILIADNNAYSGTISVISSRGCPGQCIFCSSRAFSGHKYRMHSAYWLFSLLYYYNNRLKKLNVINFMDDTFTASKNRLLFFNKCVIHNEWHHLWACKSRVDALDEKTIQLLASSGCKSIHIGVESGDQRVLDSISKGIKLEKCFKVIELLNKYSVRVECSFMIGLPEDTLETIDKTLILADQINKSKIGLANIGIATPFPGTKMYEQAVELGMVIVDTKWKNYTTSKPIFYTNNFSIDDLRKAIYIFKHDKIAMERNSIVSNSDLSSFKNQIQTWAEKVKNAPCVPTN